MLLLGFLSVAAFVAYCCCLLLTRRVYVCVQMTLWYFSAVASLTYLALCIYIKLPSKTKKWMTFFSLIRPTTWFLCVVTKLGRRKKVTVTTTVTIQTCTYAKPSITKNVWLGKNQTDFETKVTTTFFFCYKKCLARLYVAKKKTKRNVRSKGKLKEGS